MALLQHELSDGGSARQGGAQVTLEIGPAAPAPAPPEGPPLQPLAGPALLDALAYGAILAEDVAALKALHEMSFPVSYNDRFYGEVAKQQYLGRPLISVVAKGGGELVAGITAQIKVLHPEDAEQPHLDAASRERGFSRGCYVMTLATAERARRMGVGSMLLEHMLAAAERDPSCGVVYLHVITYNESAIRFYERHGFRRLRTVQGFYLINGQSFDSFLYARFLAGCERAPESKDLSLWETVLERWSAIYSRFFA
jgi:ribosomal protein S18 acetylase RimI-like enzyme